MNIKARYYNFNIGKEIASNFVDKGLLVFFAHTTSKTTTIVIDGQCELTNIGEIWEQIKDKKNNKWHNVNLKGIKK